MNSLSISNGCTILMPEDIEQNIMSPRPRAFFLFSTLRVCDSILEKESK